MQKIALQRKWGGAGLWLWIGLLLGSQVMASLAEEAGAISAPATNAVVPRPAAWAKPLDKPGLPNLHQINDRLYRGAQPTADGFKELAKLGVKTVVNLRAFHTDVDELKGSGLSYEPIPMNTWHAEMEDVAKFLSIVTDTNKTPVFVHCQHGADRTGTMNAIYRIVVQGWTKEQAIKEMTEGGYGFHGVWANLITFIKELDVDAIKRRAGIERP